ncbi:hypothetical protein AAZX31_15G047900 [Glycine max]|nr:hypothetical protein JHK87_041369 [Glycine soja]KAG4948238.1 hypothetical protein JHK86_041477 [Glycine max]KAG4955705.1 hypothetical protein JHK85_042085 [Glycine max]KAG5104450.1 hypothetical protein JHK82_041420 [Glycine max]KAG5115573.1 hypothetical protein JHK84_041686 [Glycine max]
MKTMSASEWHKKKLYMFNKITMSFAEPNYFKYFYSFEKSLGAKQAAIMLRRL